MKIHRNQDIEVVKEVLQRIQENDDYCPCNLIKSKDTKCMCLEFRTQEEEGYCRCGLYFKTKE